ncbi:MAG: DUF1294 domain-containing protein [Leptolyngbya sp. SIO1D8]|nr:DUF1294 domain-containing protein [Leptolyngbya sp. SIO1D8]
MRSSLCSGKLTKWKDERGFGFIQPVDGRQEVFLHISEVKDATRRPQRNDMIYYYCVVNSEGKARARNAFILGARNKPKPYLRLLGYHHKSAAEFISNFPIVEVLLLSILPLIGAIHCTCTVQNPIPLILYPVMSLLTYILYAEDKFRAKRKVWRISERTLHLSELACGWLGGFVAQRMLRHKTKKKSYQSVFWAIVIIHYIAWLLWLFWGRTLWALISVYG